jgi:formylglycine-generating enzyme
MRTSNPQLMLQAPVMIRPGSVPHGLAFPALLILLALPGSGAEPPAALPSGAAKPGWANAAGDDHHGRWADLRVGTATQRLRWIAPGIFVMGSPLSETVRDGDETQHQVTVSKGFWLAESCCTQAFWTALMGSNPSAFQGDQLPVETVSWNDCQQFLAKLNAQVAGLGARLPTEAEWEFACRAGTTTAYAGNGLDAMGWWQLNAHERTHEVKGKQPNAWGLYDMHGNVWEWCSDYYGEYPAGPVMDPIGQPFGTMHVARGGSWNVPASLCRSAIRDHYAPAIRWNFLGLRVLAPSP